MVSSCSSFFILPCRFGGSLPEGCGRRGPSWIEWLHAHVSTSATSGNCTEFGRHRLLTKIYHEWRSLACLFARLIAQSGNCFLDMNLTQSLRPRSFILPDALFLGCGGVGRCGEGGLHVKQHYRTDLDLPWVNRLFSM